jgi:hypothetical protein
MSKIKPGKALHDQSYTESMYGERTCRVVLLRKVTVLAVAGKWAMVRRNTDATPYVCSIHELKQ